MNRRWWKAGVAGAGTVLAGALLVVPRVDAGAATPQQWPLTPPGATGPTATVRLDSSGRLSFAIQRAGAAVLPNSALGIRTTGADLSTGLTFSARADTHLTDTYATATGRRRQHTVDATQTTLRFRKGSSRLDLVFRLSADGVAYRYVVRQSGTVTVTGEAGRVPGPTTAPPLPVPFRNRPHHYHSRPVP